MATALDFRTLKEENRYKSWLAATLLWGMLAGVKRRQEGTLPTNLPSEEDP